jgi:phosphatidylglycerophosphatase C
MDLALFDFDGTITARETFPDFVRATAPPERVACGRWQLAPWIAGYRLGVVSGTTVRAKIVDVAFRGLAAAALRERGEDFARNDTREDRALLALADHVAYRRMPVTTP